MSEVLPLGKVGTVHERSTYIFPALRVLVSVGSEDRSRSRCDFSENICYMSREREVLWADSTSIDSLGIIREKTASF